jgi:hypothetical protein
MNLYISFISFRVTTPNRFRLDFYSNNLNRTEKERAATLEKIGRFKNIAF